MQPGLNRYTMKNFTCHQQITLWPTSAMVFVGSYSTGTSDCNMAAPSIREGKEQFKGKDV